MHSLSDFTRRFVPTWQMTILTIVVVALLAYLGFWQLHRAEEKKQMLATEAYLAGQRPVRWEPEMADPEQYQSVVVKGYYLPPIILLDNQHYQHQFGFHVLTPLQLSHGKIVLIDRGWVPGDPGRHLLPTVSNPKHSLQLSGQVYYPSPKNWVLGEALEKKTENLAIIELIDTKLIRQFLHKSVYPFIIRLDKAEANGFVREWEIVSMSPERHNAYAIQWFAMAIVILAIFIGLNMKKIDENSET